jgi:hypothetical protein
MSRLGRDCLDSISCEREIAALKFRQATGAFGLPIRAPNCGQKNFASLAVCSRTLRVTPAMQLGVADHIWSIGELVDAAFEQ